MASEGHFWTWHISSKIRIVECWHILLSLIVPDCSYWLSYLLLFFHILLSTVDSNQKYSSLLLILTPHQRDYLFGEGGVQKWGSLWIWTGGLPHHNALSTPGTPLRHRCPLSDFVPRWYLFLWHNQTKCIFFTSPCWILLDCGRLG